MFPSQMVDWVQNKAQVSMPSALKVSESVLNFFGRFAFSSGWFSSSLTDMEEEDMEHMVYSYIDYSGY